MYALTKPDGHRRVWIMTNESPGLWEPLVAFRGCGHFCSSVMLSECCRCVNYQSPCTLCAQAAKHP